ncbi:hypothetical protein [Luteolibacter sp. Populi]|uniref:hypothetical protein n=1 Tax=Luteolibacter sp. Populi TaxID=3230487 RepID=UPI003464EE24
MVDCPETKLPLFVDEMMARRLGIICQAAGVDPVAFMEHVVGDLLRNALCSSEAAEQSDDFGGAFDVLLTEWEFTSEERADTKRRFVQLIREEEGRPIK